MPQTSFWGTDSSIQLECVKNPENEYTLYVLIKMGFGNGEEGTVTLSVHTEDERFPCEHGQLTHQLSRVSHKQTRFLLTVDHPLVHVQ